MLAERWQASGLLTAHGGEHSPFVQAAAHVAKNSLV